MKGVLSLLIYFIFLSIASAQVDSTYIKSFDKKYAVEFYTPVKSLAVEYTLSNGDVIALEPNSPTGIGVGFAWKNSGVYYTFNVPLSNGSNGQKSSVTDFQYHHYADSFTVDLYYQRYRGFGIASNSEVQSQEFYPEMKVNMYGGTVQFIKNYKKYSIGAAQQQSKIQLKSAGSLLYGVSLFHVKMNGLPTVHEEIVDFDKETYNFGPNIGYGYNWVIYKKFYLAAAVTVGINGVVGYNLETGITKFNIAPQLTGKTSVGYVSEGWIVSASSLLNGVYDQFSSNYDSKLFGTTFSFSIIKRFDMKKELGIFKKDLIDYLKKDETK
ncbi:MAG: DUF4421 domain-containing protein [Flavobacteriaceae bacterium]|jgi:hypothetical protein|nr:DUF4421 domain-containing protein [Flavobacteriaceae bacterium]